MNGRHDASFADGYFRITRARFRAYALLTLAIAAVVIAAPGVASAAVTLFSETFDGYTYFPSQIPSGDYVNQGLPKQTPTSTEGSDEYWYGGRFQSGGGTIDSDLFVQKVGGGTNSTPVGRFEDDAGLLFHISTVGYDVATLSFDWRTFLAETTDKFIVGYYAGNINFTSDYYDFNTTAPNWSAWTQLLAASGSNAWNDESYNLPVGQSSLWVAFWINDGEGDYGKVDNVLVMGTPVIPEPSSIVLAVIGGAFGAGAFVRRRLAQRRAAG